MRFYGESALDSTWTIRAVLNIAKKYNETDLFANVVLVSLDIEIYYSVRSHQNS